MSLSSIDSYKTFTAEPTMRGVASRRGASLRDGPDPKPFAPSRDNRGVSPHRLERALTSALESLMAKAPATSSPAASASSTVASETTDDAAASTGNSSIKEAVHEFVHALAQALRSEAHAQRSGRGHYAEMSKGLERLAEGTSGMTVEGSPTPPPVAGDGPSRVPTDDEPIYTSADSSPVKSIMPSKVDTPISLSPATDATTPATADTAVTVAAPAASRREDRLLSAFTKLFDALQPGTAAAGTPVDYAGKMRDFLHTLGQALSPTGDAALPTSGGLLNVTA